MNCNEALNINPHFHLIYADAAQQRLAALEMQAESEGGSNANGSLEHSADSWRCFSCWGFVVWLAAHPMGNFSVNHYSKITLESDRIRIRYFIDLAEIPTYQELQQANISATAYRSEFHGSSSAT